MNKVSISVNIAGKSFPLTISKDEQELVHAATERIGQTYEKYRSRFPSVEKSDILSMVLLELETAHQKAKAEPPKADDRLIDGLSELNIELENYLRQI